MALAGACPRRTAVWPDLRSMGLAHALPPPPRDHYVRAMWHYVSSLVPRPPTSASVMNGLRTLPPPPPLSQSRLQELAEVLR